MKPESVSPTAQKNPINANDLIEFLSIFRFFRNKILSCNFTTSDVFFYAVGKIMNIFMGTSIDRQYLMLNKLKIRLGNFII